MNIKKIFLLSLISLTILMCFFNNYNTVTVQATTGTYSVLSINDDDTVDSGDVLQIPPAAVAYAEILLTYLHPNGDPLPVYLGEGPDLNVVNLSSPHEDYIIPSHYDEYKASVSTPTVGYGEVALHIVLKGIAAPAPSPSPSTRSGIPASPICEHDLELKILAEPTKDAEGLMAYVCKKCGFVAQHQQQRYGAYVTYNLQLLDQLTNAPADATVTLTTTIWESFTQEVMCAIAERRDLTIILRYRIKGQDYQITIPAGAVVPTDVKYAGFDGYLAGLYGKEAI